MLPTRVGICVTGQQRTALELPVTSTFREHVLLPLRLEHATVDVHLAISVQLKLATNHTSAAALKQALKSTYDARSVGLLAAEESQARLTNTTCPIATTGARQYHGRGVLLQWTTIEACYAAVKSAENRSGTRYSWLYRVRTDLAYFGAVPSPAVLSGSHVYVPSGGMTDDVRYRCMNDHIFVCPRKLCRPYFMLLELWSNQNCVSTRGPLEHSSLGTVMRETALPQGPPVVPFELPFEPPLGYDAQWYFLARYSMARPCAPPQPVENCCGQVRLLTWPYTLVRPLDLPKMICPARHSPMCCMTRLGPKYQPLANLSREMAACKEIERKWMRQVEIPYDDTSHDAAVVSPASQPASGTTSPPISSSDVCVVTLATGPLYENSNVSQLLRANKQCYCERLGYRCILLNSTRELKNERQAKNMHMAVLRKVMSDEYACSGWVLWVDADTVFQTDDPIPVKALERSSLAFSTAAAVLCNGVMLVRVDAIARSFLDAARFTHDARRFVVVAGRHDCGAPRR